MKEMNGGTRKKEKLSFRLILAQRNNLVMPFKANCKKCYSRKHSCVFTSDFLNSVFEEKREKNMI